MFKCRFIDFLFSLIPLKKWQDFLIGHHLQRCPLCQKKMASAEEVKSLFAQQGDVESIPDLWPAVRTRLEEGGLKRPFRFRRLAWIAGAAGLLVIVSSLVWLSSISLNRVSSNKLAERFQINYIRVGNEPARAYFFKPRDLKMIIVWAEKTP